MLAYMVTYHRQQPPFNPFRSPDMYPPLLLRPKGPLTIRMAGDMPHAYIDTVAMIVTIFRPFPSFADLPVLVCLGNSHPRVLGRMGWLAFITFGIGVPMFMIPAMLHVWLMAGTANANYL